MSLARINERLAEATAQLGEIHGYILHPMDAAAIARAAVDLAGLKLVIGDGTVKAGVSMTVSVRTKFAMVAPSGPAIAILIGPFRRTIVQGWR